MCIVKAVMCLLSVLVHLQYISFNLLLSLSHFNLLPPHTPTCALYTHGWHRIRHGRYWKFSIMVSRVNNGILWEQYCGITIHYSIFYSLFLAVLFYHLVAVTHHHVIYYVMLHYSLSGKTQCISIIIRILTVFVLYFLVIYQNHKWLGAFNHSIIY